MTQEGRLKRGKANYEAGVFLDNSETQEYLRSIEQPEEPKEKPKSKEVKEKK